MSLDSSASPIDTWSRHAVQRWDERVDASVRREQAWREAIPDYEACDLVDADEVRIHHWSGDIVLMLRKNTCIVTVLTAATVQSRPLRSHLEQTYGGDT